MMSRESSEEYPKGEKIFFLQENRRKILFITGLAGFGPDKARDF